MPDEKVIEFSAELYSAISASALDYWQLGETVCGAEDPAVITLGPEFFRQYPEYVGYSVVRIIEQYVSPWKSDTFLVFSNKELTGDEYQRWDSLDD